METEYTNVESTSSEDAKITNRRSAVSFIIETDNNPAKQKKPPPNRFSTYQKKKITSEDIKVKQHEAESRRKEKERQMTERLIEKRQECQKLNAHFEELLAQHAKRQGLEGTENIPKMSSKELIEKFRTVNKHYAKMAGSISSPNTYI